MITEYSIDEPTKTLVFTGNPEFLTEDSLRRSDKVDFTSVVIPNSVSIIDARAFERCSALVSIHIPNSVSAIGAQAFERCTSLASVHIPNSVSTIEKWAFEDCQSVLSIHIPNSITAIENSAFLNCSSLASVRIPNSVKTIKREAFSLCSFVASIHLPNSVSIIGGWAFSHCHSLHKACLLANAKSDATGWHPCFPPQTALLRPKIKPIRSLQKKSACCIPKAPYFIYL